MANQMNGTLSDDSSDSDNGSMSSLSSEEIERHFLTKHDRRFHSHGTVPYPLPADAAEMQVSSKARRLIFCDFLFVNRDSIECTTPSNTFSADQIIAIASLRYFMPR